MAPPSRLSGRVARFRPWAARSRTSSSWSTSSRTSPGTTATGWSSFAWAVTRSATCGRAPPPSASSRRSPSSSPWSPSGRRCSRCSTPQAPSAGWSSTSTASSATSWPSSPSRRGGSPPPPVGRGPGRPVAELTCPGLRRGCPGQQRWLRCEGVPRLVASASRCASASSAPLIDRSGSPARSAQVARLPETARDTRSGVLVPAADHAPRPLVTPPELRGGRPGCHTTGSSTRKVVPTPSSDSTSIRPRCRRTTRSTTARPSPVPGRLRASTLVGAEELLEEPVLLVLGDADAASVTAQLDVRRPALPTTRWTPAVTEPPGSEYLSALETRLPTRSSSSPGSPRDQQRLRRRGRA